jgi:hypothetical protein
VLPQTSHAICEIPPTRLQPSRKNITKRLKGGVEKKIDLRVKLLMPFMKSHQHDFNLQEKNITKSWSRKK